MPVSHWHKLYTADINASPAVLFRLVADMPNYGRWLPGSASYGSTTDVEPYPVKSPDFSHQDHWTSTIRSMPGR
jgi:hypothetical protein